MVKKTYSSLPDFKIIVLNEIFQESAQNPSVHVPLKTLRGNLGQWSARAIEGGFVQNIQGGYVLAYPSPEKPQQCSSTENLKDLTITDKGIDFIRQFMSDG